MSTPTEVFSDIYARNVWGGGSGGGSDPALCGPYCRFVEKLLVTAGVRSVLDLGCGDGRVAAAIKWGGVRYTGIDCARVALHKHPGFDIRLGDILADPLPDADLVLIKEVTQHLPNADVSRLMARLSGYPLVLHCSGYDGVPNVDIRMGETRPVDLALPPFSLNARTVLTYGGGYTVQMLEGK
jgi:SAM-dependent methyltransferase